MFKDYNLLKEVLSIPTVTYKEEKMIDFLTNWLNINNYHFFVDKMKNIYVTKNTTIVDHYPCFVAHMDTVHSIDTINIKEEFLKNEQGELKKSLKAYNDLEFPTGIGGDNKCGIFACLQLLKELPNVKICFFVSEETGCHGSKNADQQFFNDVGYCVQFDAPGNTMVTEYSMGVKLFDRNSEFFKTSNKILTENLKGNFEYGSHPYTDVYALKQKFDFSCINISIGYYKYHTKNEYVVIEDVYNGIEIGKKLVKELGYKKYPFSRKEKTLFF
jgi:tripeptide aminopeptidase